MRQLLGATLLLLAAAGCRSPTQITVEVTAEGALCTSALATSLTAGTLDDIDVRPPAAATVGCAQGFVGSVVLIPSGGEGDQVAFRVLASIDGHDCTQTFDDACIEERRSLRYIPHDPLIVEVPLRVACEGVTCADPATTCVGGACVPDEIDPTACEGSGCGESALAAPDGGLDAARDATVDATIADAVAEASPPADANADVGADAGGDASPDADAGSMYLIGAGDAHSCALYADGRLACWGDSSYGVLGATDGGSFYVPTFVPFAPRAIGLSTGQGADHQCVVLGDAAVACWGDDSYGQIAGGGDGGVITSPVIVAGLGPVGEVRTGEYATCALAQGGGSVACWGLVTYVDTQMPGPGAAIAGVVAPVLSLSGGPAIQCAASRDAGATCWGSNENGLLLDGGPSIDEQAFGIPGMLDVVAISVGGAHACAVRASGAVTCWGENDTAQLGRGTVDAPGQDFGPQDLPAFPSPALDVSAGEGHACARLANGDVYCWGRDDAEQSGGSGQQQQPNPTRIALSGATSIAAGTNHTCAVLQGTQVVCWGDNGAGQLGIGTAYATTGVPVAVVLPP